MKPRSHDDRAIPGNLLDEPQVQAAPQRQRLRQDAPHDDAANRAVARDNPKNRLPAEGGKDKPAERRRQDRRDPHHQHELAHHPRRRVPVRQVADNGARDHHAGRAADRRQQPHRRQRREVGRQRAARSRPAVYSRGAGDQRPAPAEPVGQRALGDLPDREPQEPGGERDLRRARPPAERRLDRGERRQVHVGRDRPDRREQPEQRRQPRGEHSSVHAAVRHRRPAPIGNGGNPPVGGSLGDGWTRRPHRSIGSGN